MSAPLSTRRIALLLVLASPLAASAATARKRSARAKSNPQDNGESRTDRDRRLARECRNLPNSGACQGFGYGS